MDRTASVQRWQQAAYVALAILGWLAVAIVVIWLLAHVVKTLLTLVLAGIIAFALTPLVSLFSRWMSRGLAIAAAYVLGFACILGMLAFLIVTAANETLNLVQALPGYANELQQQEPHIVHLLRPFGVTHAKLHIAQGQIVSHLQDVGTVVANDSLDIVTTTLGAIIDIVLVLILSVYLSANGTRISQRLRRETPTGQRRHMVLLITIVNQVVGGYIRGQLTLALLVGALVGVGMFILHVPYAVLLGIFAFFMEFVPVIGVLISGAVCVGLALFQGWLTAVFVLLYFVVVHVIEGDVVGPRIIGRAVGIHPATALVALVAGTELFGIWGALLGAPIAGLVQAIATAAWREFRTGDPATTAQIVVEHVKRHAGADATPMPQHEVGPQA